ncbi:ATP-binding protein [Methanolobus sp. ZRKC2]|uniref:sensor histidine kinase n=1 Tax=Methanolobus sp. ZRKC2 TaxID=3125783 RepID=UPI00324BE193
MDTSEAEQSEKGRQMKIPNLANSVFLLIVCVFGIIIISPLIVTDKTDMIILSSFLIAVTFATIIYASSRIDKMNLELEGKINELNLEKAEVENLVEKNSKIENALSSLISLFIAPKDVDMAIKEALQRTGQFCNCECNYLILIGKDENSLHMTCCWSQENSRDRKTMFENLNISSFPWLAERLHEKQILSISELCSLPNQATKEKNIMISRGVESLLIVPVDLDEKTIGFIGIENSDISDGFSDEWEQTLKILSELLGMAVQHKFFLNDLSLFKSLIDESNDFIFVIEPGKGTIIDVNETACHELGYSRDEFMKMSGDEVEKIFGGRFWEKYIQDICGDRFLDIDKTMIRKEGSSIPVEINVTFTDHENNSYALAIVRDVTKRKEIEENLKKTQERVELALKGADLGMWDWNLKTNELIYNERWAEMLDYEAREIKPKIASWMDLIHPEDIPAVKNNINLHLEDKTPFFESEFRMQNKNKSWQWILTRGKVVEWTNINEPFRLAGTTMDTSERKKFEEELRHSNELKDLFTDIMRHDLLNPAGNVKGFTDLLLELEDNEKNKKLLNNIKRNNDKLIEMIEIAAKFAKLESVEDIRLERMDIGAILRNVIEQFEHKLEDKQMTLELRAKGTYHSMLNPIIEEIFVNFISNAIKYSPEGTPIIVDVVDTNYHWKVEVADFGEGIPDDDKPLVFDRFKRVNKRGVKGTGLGLAIVKRIAEIVGGEVGVEDNPEGQGSKFWVKLKKYSGDTFYNEPENISQEETLPPTSLRQMPPIRP